jgi:hypothetical protein
MNRGRVQAQGNGTEKSESWATSCDFTKEMGLAKLDRLESTLTNPELSLRTLAIQQARNRVESAPACGINAIMKKSYYDDKTKRAIRIDVEINAGTSFVDPLSSGDGNG